MISLKVTVHGHNNEMLVEREFELEYDIDSDADRGSHVVMTHPTNAERIVLDAVDSAEDFLNENPELWANGGPEDI